MDSKIPLILGQPFLAIANALINCRNGLMKLSFGNMTLEVNVFNVEKQPREEDDEGYHTNMIDPLVMRESNQNFSNSLHNLPYESKFKTLLCPAKTSNVFDDFNDLQDKQNEFWPLDCEEVPCEGGESK